MNFFLKCRKQRKLSQHEVGIAIGTTGGAVGMWERGCYPPPLKYSVGLAAVYGVSEARVEREIVQLSKSISAAKLADAGSR